MKRTLPAFSVTNRIIRKEISRAKETIKRV